MNFDLTTTNLEHLLEQVAPDSWKRNPDCPAPGIQVTDNPLSKENVTLARLAPDLAREVIYTRLCLAQLDEVLTAIAECEDSSPAGRSLARRIDLHINQLLADHDKEVVE